MDLNPESGKPEASPSRDQSAGIALVFCVSLLVQLARVRTAKLCPFLTYELQNREIVKGVGVLSRLCQEMGPTTLHISAATRVQLELRSRAASSSS